MLPSIRAFLAEIIDYAGLFPPAQLPLDQALRNYARYRTEPESWMLGRFVCPAERLHELEIYRDNLLQLGEPFPFAVVLSTNARATASEALQWRSSYQAIGGFCKLHGARVTVPALEIRLPTGFLSDTAGHADQLSPTECIDWVLDVPGLPLVVVYFEYELRPTDSSALHTLVSFLTQDPLRRRGYKLRCGGLHAATFPSVEQVACTIAACRDAGVPLKFTAGLHQPIRHYDSGVQTHVHGFLNLFGAGILAHARNLSEEQICQIVGDEDAGDFVFREDSFCWKDHQASVAEITAARQQAVISFGSCSFDEPRDELRKMGLLD